MITTDRRTQTPPEVSSAVVGTLEPNLAEQVRQSLEQMGWNVTTPQDACATEHAMVKLSGGFVVLSYEQGGLLSAAKLRLTRPQVRVLLLGCRSERQIQEAYFVGAIPLADASELCQATCQLKV